MLTTKPLSNHRLPDVVWHHPRLNDHPWPHSPYRVSHPLYKKSKTPVVCFIWIYGISTRTDHIRTGCPRRFLTKSSLWLVISFGFLANFLAGSCGKFLYEALTMKYCSFIFHNSTHRHTNPPQHAERLEYYNRAHWIFRNFGSVGISRTLFL